MADPRTVFKRCMEQACSAVRAEFGRFAAAVGLNDFLLDAFDVPRIPKELAAMALDQLCEGKLGLTDRIVCLAAIAFLDETLGAPKQDPNREVRLRDLKDLVEARSTPEQFERWIETWYE